MMARLLQFASDECIDVICASFHRTAEEQKALFDKGLSRCDGITKRSRHQDWLAMDLYVIKDDKVAAERIQDYEKLGMRWEDIGGVWGGRFESLNDIFHFELGEPA